MPPPPATPDGHAQAASAAGQAARSAVHRIALDAGAPVITRELYPGSGTTIRDVEPLAGAAAARHVELAARHAARDYVRQAREAGCTWHQIGTAMHLTPGGDARQAGDTTAEAAYAYAAGKPDTETARRYGRSFTWRCGSCEGLISDHGLISGPAEDERGHAEGCAQLAATVAAWDAEWEAGQ